jgi:hypothetical protein
MIEGPAPMIGCLISFYPEGKQLKFDVKQKWRAIQ